MLRSQTRAGLVLVVVALAAGCGGQAAAVRERLTPLIAGDPVVPAREAVLEDVRRFYEHRGRQPAWLNDRDLARARGILEQARQHGLDPADYALEEIARASRPPETIADTESDPEAHVAALAERDVLITTALLSLGRDVALGRVDPQAIWPSWEPRREPPPLAASLAGALDDGSVETWLNQIRPRHPEYAALQGALEGLLADTAPIEEPERTERAARIAVNLDRWRWIPDELGSPHVLVNVPEFRMFVREDGRSILDMRAIVGDDTHQTPLFSAEMKTVVFSPYWNIPQSIALAETAPAAHRDQEYIRRNNIEVLRVSDSRVEVVDPDDVDWDDPDEVRQLRLRQRPGAANALGHVKFLFPNRFAVYLHDTPADELFARDKRALSHGCVRLDEPAALARFVLRNDPSWDADRIAKAMRSGTEREVALPAPLPVHLLYFTAIVGPEGELTLLDDVYGHDARHAAHLRQPRETL